MNTMGISISGDVVLHPGWSGRLLLVVRNNNRFHPVELLPGAKIGHVQFSVTPTAQYSGKFQHIGVSK
jgi:deoxycytidine triphosphate deaminase